MERFNIYSDLTDELCGTGVRHDDGSQVLTIDNENIKQDPTLARCYMALLPQVGFRVDWQE
jgi:hypothetical protein